MTNWEKQMAEKMQQLKMERKRTYADAIEALSDYQLCIENRQAQVDSRYAKGQGDSELTKLMERDAAKMRYALEQMQGLIAYIFDADESEIREDMAS